MKTYLPVALTGVLLLVLVLGTRPIPAADKLREAKPEDFPAWDTMPAETSEAKYARQGREYARQGVGGSTTALQAVRARRFDLVNDRGQIAASLLCEKDGTPRLVFYDAQGRITRQLDPTTPAQVPGPAQLPQRRVPVTVSPESPPQWKPCPACNGSGLGGVVCRSCSGTGISRGSACPMCEGRRFNECWKCAGKGMTQDR